MMIWGQLLEAGLEHSSSDPTPAFKGRVYWNTTDEVPKVYDGSNWIKILALDSNDVLNLDKQLVITELSSTPSNPSSGFKAVYAKDDGKVYTLDSAGNELEIGSGGGGGSLNYIENNKAETGEDGWVTYKESDAVTFTDSGDTVDLTAHGLNNGDTVSFTSITSTTGISTDTLYYVVNKNTDDFQVSATSGGSALTLTTDGLGTVVRGKPVDGVGGSANITWARNTTTPLREFGDSNDFKFTKDAANRMGEGVAYAFTIDKADKNKTLRSYVDYDATEDSAYAAGDLKYFIIEDPSGTPRVINPAGSNSFAAASTEFDTTITTSSATSYALIIHCATPNTSAYDVYFTNFKVGPELTAQGVPQSDWDVDEYEYTPNSSAFGTVASQTWSTKRIGDTVYVRGQWTAGTLTSSTAALAVPSGLPMDTSKLSNNQVLGELQRIRTGTSADDSTINSVTLYYNSGNTDNIYLQRASGSDTFTAVGGTGLGATGDTFVVYFSYPVSRWANSAVNLSTAKAEYASNSGMGTGDDTSSFAYGPSGSPLPSVTYSAEADKTVRFLTAIQPTDILQLELDALGTGAWAPQSGVIVAGSGNAAVSPLDRSNEMGVGDIKKVNSTDVTVTFERYRNGTANWDSDSGQARWRVVKYPGVIQSATVDGTEPTTMTDATATKLGHKIYSHGTTYKNGNAPTITVNSGGSLSSVDLGNFIPFQTQDGNWYLDINVAVNVSSGTRTSQSFDVAGITFYNGSNQALAGGLDHNASKFRTLAIDNSNTVSSVHTSQATTRYQFTGRVLLDSKPTWAY